MLEHAAGEPVAMRARLYRALAQICGVPAERDTLEALAGDFEDLDERCRAFILRFNQQTTDNPLKP